MEKHFITEIADDRLVVVRDEDSIKAEAALDGIYVLRTTIGSGELNAAGVISAYKDLAGVEQDFRSMKVIDVELRRCTTAWRTACGHTPSSACSPPISASTSAVASRL